MVKCHCAQQILYRFEPISKSLIKLSIFFFFAFKLEFFTTLTDYKRKFETKEFFFSFYYKDFNSF